jgi:hypothetical protein
VFSQCSDQLIESDFWIRHSKHYSKVYLYR